MSVVILARTESGEPVEVSDGFHTFTELYEHRIALYISLCKLIQSTRLVWRTLTHSDGTFMSGWFVLGIGKYKGEQITYHLPLSQWDACNFAETLDRAPEFDGHSSADVLERIAKL